MTSLAIKLLLELFLLIQMYTIYIKEVTRRDFLGVLKTFLYKLGQNHNRVVEYIQKTLVFFPLWIPWSKRILLGWDRRKNKVFLLFFFFSYGNDAHLLVIYLNGEEQQCGTSRMPDDHKVTMLANNLDAIYLSSFTFSVIFCFSARYDEFAFSVYTLSTW